MKMLENISELDKLTNFTSFFGRKCNNLDSAFTIQSKQHNS